MSNKLALVSQLPPRYLCCYGEQIDATQLCLALDKYGIKAEIRPPYQNAPKSQRPAYFGQPVQWGFSVWICNGCDYDRAVEFKRGLLAVCSVRGDHGAFIDGIMMGAQLRGKGPAKKMLEVKQLRLKA